MADLTGTSGDDRLTGTGADDHIDGLEGNDLLNGGGGTDVLVGGIGNDGFIVDSLDDQVVENASEGADTVYAIASYILAAGVSVEILAAYDRASTYAFDLTGNNLNQTIIGNNGDNFLDGGAGGDRLYGLFGNDSYLVDTGGDGVAEFAGQGNDTVYTTVSYVLADNSEIEFLRAFDTNSTSPITLTGNNLAQTIYGNAGVNMLNGGGGTAADTMYGLGGDDGYIARRIDDRAMEAVGGGIDTVYAQSSHTLAAGSEIEVLTPFNRTGTTAYVLTGNEFGQTVIGNAGDNVIDGGAGADFLYGLGGADTFQFTALGIGNADRIGDFAVGVDRIALDSHAFTGLATGALPAGAFVLGTSAQDADDRIIYDQATGHLFFDADGSNSEAAVVFALLGGAPALTSGDFVVI